MKCSIGVFAYNEEKNIARLLEALLKQKLEKVEISEIIIIASGCTDDTVLIAREFIKKDKRIKLLIQKKREGKFSAINLFLKTASSKILVIQSGDTISHENAIEELVRVFKNKSIGMAGTRPVPVNRKDCFWGFLANILWGLHHEISLKTPKTGEMVAFLNDFPGLKPTSVDEALIESWFKNHGFEIVYVPSAIVYNKGPENLRDFLAQRRRIHYGHLDLKNQENYQVSTMDSFKIFLLLRKIIKRNPDLRKSWFWLFGVIGLEAWARGLGIYDFYFKKNNHIVWKRINSTKNLE